ncbi:MAG: hypothetical protein KKA81_06875, partial [Bacteroidetes bacterium]|nr:hypothetical protein [Bacteroidota bacterium]
MKKLSISQILAFLACLFFSSIGMAQSPTELEKELLHFFIKNDFDVSNLNFSTSDTEIISEGPATFLGISNVQLRILQNASDSKLKKIAAIFPASANIDLLKLSKFSGGSLGRLVPISLRKSSSLYIKDLDMDIADDGKSVSTCEFNFTGKNWDAIGFGDFQINEIAIKLFRNPRGYGGTLSSTSNFGNAVFETQCTLSTEEEPVITSTLSQAVTVDEIVSKLGGSYTQQFWLLFPNDNIKQVSIDQVEVALYPLEKLIIVRGMSSAGKMAFLFRQSGKNRSIAIEAAPATLDKIVGSSFLDAMDFESPIIVMSNFADREYPSLLLNENSTMDIAKGLNVMSSVNLGRDFENIFKTSHIYFYGSIGKNKNIRLTGETKNDIPLGTSKLRFKKLDFRIATESSPAKPPSIGMEGTLNLEISESESLDFIAGMKSQIAPLQIGGWIELDAKGGNGMWENPFGMPCLGIKNLKGAISLSPSIIVSELGLGGDLHIAKKFDGSYRPIIVQLDMMLSVTDPWSSKIEGYAQQINIASFLEAITEVKLDGELRTMLSTGIESAYIQFNPKEHLFSASGDFNLMGVKSSISMGMNEQNVFAKGTMDPFEIKAGDFRIFGIYGIAGPKPSFHVELGANPHLMIDGRVVVLETMEGGALVDINSSGFYVKAQGKIFGGAFTGDLEAWGKDLNSSPSLYASLSLSPSIINSVQSQLTQWMEQQGAQSAKEIEKLKKGINSGNAVIDQIGAGTLDAIKTMSTETATLGVLVSKNMIPSIKEITFKGNLDKSGANMRFGIQVQLGNQVMDPVYVDINLKGDLQSQLNQIADILKKQILAEFADLGKGVIQQAQELGKFFEDVGKEIVNVAQNAGESIVQVTKVLDEFWNGKSLPAPFNGEQLSKIPMDYRHYEIQLTGIRCINADDQAFLGDAAVELYGGIYFIPSNMTTSRNTNDIVYSVNRDASDNNKFSSGTYKNQYATKHFYVRDGQQHGITVKVELLDSDKGGSVAEDDKIRGSKYIDLSGWQWGTDTRVSQEKITTSGSGTFEVDVKIILYNKIGEREFLLAIEHGSTSELTDLLNKGGNLQNECLLTRAIQKRDANMVNFLIANNAKYCPDDINFAFAGSDFSEPIVVNLLLKYNPAVNSGHLQQAIAINSTRVTESLL